MPGFHILDLLCSLLWHSLINILAYFLWEALEGGSGGVASLAGLEAADDVLECGCHNKVLLLQTKFFSFKELEHRKETGPWL